MLLERIGFISGEAWLESHADVLSLQAALFKSRARSWASQVAQHMAYTARVESG